jgi:hypothetical protein
MKKPMLIKMLGDLMKAGPGGIVRTPQTYQHRSLAMNKTEEPITEVVRDPKHPFRKIENQPKKAQRHRYERRKIKEYLHLADFLMEETV